MLSLRNILTAFFLLMGTCLFAQNDRHGLDTLLQKLPGSKQDTNKVNLLHDLSEGYRYINSDSGLLFGKMALELAEKLKWEKGIADANNIIAANYQYKSNFPVALEYYFKVLKSAEGRKDNYLIATATANIGTVYYAQADYTKALEYSNSALKKYQETGYKYEAASTMGNIGLIYESQGNNAKALVEEFDALKICEEIKDRQGIEIMTGNIGDVYTDEKNYPAAIYYLQEALKMDNDRGDKRSAAFNLANIGNSFLLLVQDTAAARAPKDAVANELAVKKHIPGALPTGRGVLLRNAIDYTLRAEAILNELHAWDAVEVCDHNLAEAYKLSGDYKKALEYTDRYHAIKDSVFSKENDEKIVKMGVEYEYGRRIFADSMKAVAKEKVAAVKQQKQAIINWVLVASLALGVLIIVIVVNVYRRTLRKNALLSEQKQTIDVQNTELGKNIREKDRILAVVAHDLRSPVGAIAYLADMMQMEGSQSMKPEDSIAMIKTASASSLELINELLGLSNNSKEELEKENTELNSFVSGCVKLLQYKAEEKQQTIIMQPWESPVHVWISREKMSRVINNLVTNAIKFTPNGGEIRVAVQKKDTSVLITVKDTGIGIPKAMQAEVFEIFTPAKRKGTGGEKSFGLGMSVCRQIVAAHGGQIWLESEEGRGTTFYVELNT